MSCHSIQTIDNQVMKTILDNTQDAIFFISVEGNKTFRYLRANKEFENKVGVSLNDLKGKTPYELFNKQEADYVLNKYLQCCEIKDEVSYEKTLDLSWGKGKFTTKLSPIIENNKVVKIIGISRDITDYKNIEELTKAKEKLEKENKHYKSLLDTQSDIVVRWRPDATITYVNKAHCDLMGMDKEEILGKQWFEFIPDDSKEELRNAYFDIIKNPRKVSYEHPEIGAGGKIYWQHKLVYPIFDHNGELVEFQSVGRDITESKWMQIRKQSQNQVLTALTKRDSLNNILELIVRWLENEDRKAIGAVMLLDESKEYLYCKTAPNLPRFFRKLLEGIKVKDGSLSCGTAAYKGKRVIVDDIEKHPYWADFHKIIDKVDIRSCWSEPVFSSEGDVIGTFAIYLNEPYTPTNHDLERLKIAADLVSLAVTHKMSEEKLKLNERKFKSFVENASDIVLTVNDKGVITYVSPNWKQLLGHNPTEVIGKTADEFIHPEDLETFFKKLKKLIETGNLDEEVEYRIKHKNGTWKWHASTINILGQNKENTDLLGIARDVTERKQAEEKIRYLSFHDNLTGLYNRAYLEEKMKKFDTETHLPLSVIMIDLNGLKLVNDTYGHFPGDNMLKSAAKVLKDSSRKDDFIARWGGDEFVILLPNTSKEDANKVCKRIFENCKKVYVKNVPISLAVGTATKSNIGKDLKLTLKEAEDKMYKQKLAVSQSARSTVLKTLIKTLESKSFETKIHTQCMEKAAFKIGKKLDLSDSELKRLSLLISLHDIGKINIPEEVLTKKEPLTQKERESIKKHPITGYRIALATEEFSHIAEEILNHHERWDGSGYPNGNKGEDIPLLARITSIVDAYEVMTNGRPYKKTLTQQEIKAELKRCAGTQFDPRLVKTFLEVLED
ncbi:PAS domain S-box protein [Natranaerobius trueperi]|uniref:PAS domain S-box protein n=1 Tax=Natranaerobius trueperi TaxID=759412 RepID=A0A226BZQ6_9FIRM|nr:PAS domain S-box protein [Natranaerobius trueperi]OWZ83824.1 hypothetical protein CDO51_06180 [Natranaerobius trueperi]